MVEVVEGMDALSPIAEPERHLKGNFRLSCQTSVVAAEGRVRCHTMRRGHMRIERHGFGLPISNREFKLDPAVTRDGDRILIDSIEIEQSNGPILGIAMDLGTTTVVLRLVDLETGELIADTSFENPQRFGGSEVMSRIAYDTEHPGKLLMRMLAVISPTPSRASPSIRKTSTKWLWWATPQCAICSFARACIPSGRLLTSPSPKSK